MFINFNSLSRSFYFAGRGLVKVFREEQNIRIQLILASFMCMAGFVFGLTVTEWMFLLTAVFMVVIIEVVNSALERLTDILKPRINTYVKEIKDVMAAAVVLASLFSVLIGVLIFGKYLLVFLTYAF